MRSNMDYGISVHITLLLLAMFVKQVIPTYRTDFLRDSCGCSYLDQLLCNPFHLLPQDTGAGHISLSRSPNFSKPFYCQFVIEAPENQGVQLAIDSVELPDTDNCQDSMLRVYDGVAETVNSWAIATVCGKTPKETLFRSGKNKLTVFYTHGASVANFTKSFNLTYTYFQVRNIGVEGCDSSHFRCDNGLCVSSKVTCDGVNNCWDNSDEAMDYQMCGSLSRYPFVALVVGGVMSIIVLIALVSAIGYAVRRKNAPYVQANRVPPDERVHPGGRPRGLEAAVEHGGDGEAVLTPDIMRDLPHLAIDGDSHIIIAPDGTVNNIQTGIGPVLPPSYSMLFPDPPDEA